ncbi:hypothetical protein TSMEX_011819 [Taenia solium]|eukprot:TsM_000091000 transcript=TsM_000091000 gene=TsM_000091000
MKETTSSKFKGVAPSREERKACWAARDAFWDCIKVAYSKGRQVPEELADTVNVSQCLSLRRAYEAVCPESWIRLFDRQHDFDLFRASTAEESLKERVKNT